MRKAGVILALIGALIGASFIGTVGAAPSSPKSVAIPPGTVVIDDDPGGIVDTYLMWYGRIKQSGAPVVLRGVCVSACTFILALPKDQVCVEPTASLGFHLATMDGKADPWVTIALINRYYPPAVRAWIKERWPLKVWPILYMSANEIISLGIFSPCNVAVASSPGREGDG